MDKKEFVEKCGELLSVAKPHLIKTELKLGKEIEANQYEKYLPEEEYAVITCQNGYTYKLPIAATSLCGIAATIFGKMAHK